jgi:NhaA family Na+:H+ antiporter
MRSKIYKLFSNDAIGGILIIFGTVLAMIFANTQSLTPYYEMFRTVPVAVSVGSFAIAKPLLLWINDGLMAVFFLAVGLELKREFIEGHLAERKNTIMPLMGAFGGMIVPAAIYWFFNHQDKAAMSGWAIPMATDIAFALGILMLFGKRVPVALKVLLVSMAIFDDLGAIAVIAIFYTSKLSVAAMLFAFFIIIVLFLLNRIRVSSLAVYIILGIFLWIAVLKSGIHATLAGILLAIFIPYKSSDGKRSISKELEHDLDGSITYLILPLFAFVNAGVGLGNLSSDVLLHPITLGVALGLFIGKQLGVFFFCWMSVKLGIAKLPKELNWQLIYGISLLAGIGFTMSLFIDSLAFEQAGESVTVLLDGRLGILIGSLISGIAGVLVLKKVLKAA